MYMFARPTSAVQFDRDEAGLARLSLGCASSGSDA